MILIAQLITNLANGYKADYWLPQAIIATILVLLLYIEYRCYMWMRGGIPILLPH